MEVHISNSKKYHELVTTDEDLAKAIAKKYFESSTFITINRSNCEGKTIEVVYQVTWRKDVGNIQPNVDDNLFI